MLSVEQSSELIQYACGRLALESTYHVTQDDGRRVAKQEVDVIGLAVNLGDLAVALRSQSPQYVEQKVSPLSGEYMPAKLRTENDVCRQVVNAVACCVKVKIPDTLAHGLDDLLARCSSAVERMLSDRSLSSSKYYSDLVPCVVSKSLISKYQKNPKCKRVQNLVIPVCGDKGKQIKMAEGGIRIPAVFKKEVLPVDFPKKISGHVRNIEFFKRSGDWFASICYPATVAVHLQVQGCVGIDRNTVGNIAVLSDPQNGKVKILGVSAAAFKYNFRRRKAELMSQGRRRHASQLRRKQERRTKYENHRTSKAIVDYAQEHCRAIAIEDLGGVTAKDSKIKGYTQKSQWAFTQLESFVQYKARLAGVPIIEVDPAYTSQTCSRCGERHKPSGKTFQCPSCGSKQHRDANSGFVIAQRGNDILSGAGSGVENGAPLGPEPVYVKCAGLLGGPLSGNGGHSNE
jgi:IS605 OrfB family transposase